MASSTSSVPPDRQVELTILRNSTLVEIADTYRYYTSLDPEDPRFNTIASAWLKAREIIVRSKAVEALRRILLNRFCFPNGRALTAMDRRIPHVLNTFLFQLETDPPTLIHDQLLEGRPQIVAIRRPTPQMTTQSSEPGLRGEVIHISGLWNTKLARRIVTMQTQTTGDATRRQAQLLFVKLFIALLDQIGDCFINFCRYTQRDLVERQDADFYGVDYIHSQLFGGRIDFYDCPIWKYNYEVGWPWIMSTQNRLAVPMSSMGMHQLVFLGPSTRLTWRLLVDSDAAQRTVRDQQGQETIGNRAFRLISRSTWLPRIYPSGQSELGERFDTIPRTTVSVAAIQQFMETLNDHSQQ